jgi:hypothetical protein
MTTMSEAHTTRRRDFLKLLVLSGVGPVAMPSRVLGKRRRAKHRQKVVFRLQTRKHYSCRACKRHHRFTIFRTLALADGNRAHPGCNCPIVRQTIRGKEFKRIFGPNGVAPNGVVDVRATPRAGRRSETA